MSKPATRKGEATRDLILDHAHTIASEKGVEGLSIGDLASAVGMSKSGVFAHFGSREELQLALLDAVGRHFAEQVFIPALRKPRGLARLRTIVAGWFDWALDNRDGCPIMGAVSEYDSRPGPQRDRIIALLAQWRAELARAIHLAVEVGELGPTTDAAQLVFEIFGVAFALHHDTRLFDAKRARQHADRALERLIAANSTAVGETATRKSSRA
ncbi:MAG: TetR/AcrR family transcriptional regulator [Rudaea sp.]